jgi:hypothetical protein
MGLTSITNGQASKNSVSEIGLNTSVSFYNYIYRGSINPYLTFRAGRTGWTAGPLILVSSNIGSNTSNGPKLTGLCTAYGYFPQMQSERFEFYLGAEVLAQRIKDVWQANAFDDKLGAFRNFSYQNVELLLESYLGYGVKLKFGKHWYLSNGIGAGCYFSKLVGDELDADAPEIDNFDYRGYDDFGFSWNMKLGVGFNL